MLNWHENSTRNSFHQILQIILKAFQKTFPQKWSLKNNQQKRKIRRPRKANEEKRSEVKQKKKVETCVTAGCVTFKPKNFEFWLLHILKFWKLIFCIWNRRLTSKCFLVSFCSWQPGSFKNMFFGKISRGKLVNTFISNYGHMFYLLLKLTAVNHTGFIQIFWSNIHNFFQTFYIFTFQKSSWKM